MVEGGVGFIPRLKSRVFSSNFYNRMTREPRSVFRDGVRGAKADAHRRVTGMLHHVHIMCHLDRLARDDVENHEYHSVFGPDNQFDHQLRAIENEFRVLCHLFDARDEVDECIERGFSNSDRTVAVEVNYGRFGDAGIEVFRGNKHREADFSCGLGPDRSNSSKKREVERMIEAAIEAYHDEGAVMLVFTSGEDRLHVGGKGYDRANEALLQMAQPGIIERILG